SSCFHAHAAPQSSPLSLHDALPILLNQSVLLAGVNDSADVLVELSETLFDAGVLPYYLHLLDKVHGAAHFDVAEQDAIALHEQIMNRLPGYLVPRLVREIPGAPSKTPVRSRELPRLDES